MTRIFLSLVFLLPACAPTESEEACAGMVIRDADGNPDPCDMQACKACQAACNEECVTLEVAGSNYHCSNVDSWSAVDFCPDWQAQ